eukprot:scaffold10586_cov46-Attheya_sp.AAC.4
MLEPTRLYGLAGYNVLLIIPVGTRSADAPKNRPTTREEVIALARGCATDDGGFRPETNAAKLRICAWCKKSSSALENKPLKKCSGCNDSFYCSREHQKLDWKQHKIDCVRSDEKVKTGTSVSEDKEYKKILVDLLMGLSISEEERSIFLKYK